MRFCIGPSQTHLAEILIHVHYETFTAESETLTGIYIAQYWHESSIMIHVAPIY